MDEDDYDFSDADLDDLPANTLQELETTAIQATQQQQQSHNAIVEDSAFYELDHDGEDEVVNLDDDRGAPRFPPNAAFQTYGTNDRFEARRDYNTNSNHGDSLRYADADAMDVEEAPRQSQVDVGRLLDRIKKLEQEKHSLNHNLRDASAEVIKKTGEADNLRRRAEQATRTNEQRLAQQQQEHRESTGRITAERDALLRQLEHAKTNSAFDEHSRHEEQMRRPSRVVPSRPKPQSTVIASPAATPKRAQKTLPLGDGFDDDDVMMISPSKRRDKSKQATPKQAASKRKRQITNDSPVPVLELSEPRERPKAPGGPLFSDVKLDIALLRNLCKDDQRFTLLHRLLSHRCFKSSDRVLEALTQYAFPSDSEKKLSSIVYDHFSTTLSSANAQDLALSICRIFVNIWKQALREKYYKPIFLIQDALHFVLVYEPPKTAVVVMEDIIPLIVDSVKLVAIPVYEARNRNEKKTTFLFSSGYEDTVAEVDVQNCLELLYLLATRCVASPSPEPLSRFWQNIPLDFVLLVLLKEQPIPDMLLLLRILPTSALPTSLGPIVSSDPDAQKGGESNLISRLTNLFSETLAPIPDSRASCPAPAVPEDQIWKVRLKILDVLTHFSLPKYGSTTLVQHSLCIGRLIKYLSHAVSSLYTRPLSPTQPLKIQTINTTMKLLNHLTTSNPGFNIKSKLNETLGGLHAYYVSLTRLAFSEGWVLEEGVEREVADMAHDILDEGLSPEEGEALGEVFPSAESG